MLDKIILKNISILLPMVMLAACSTPSENAEASTKASQKCEAGTPQETAKSGLSQVTLCIDNENKTHSFTVELALTVQEQATGMMHRTELADDRGMIFPYKQARPLSFWMKNTLIPLDIIYISTDGSIESINANAVPYSLKSIPSKGPAIAALELRGGLAKEIGLQIGDKVRWAK